MYGLVNQALERMVCDHHGEETWEQVKLRADVDTEMFIGMHVYPDDVTFRLLEATSAVIDTAMHELLYAFGNYWLTFTAQVGHDHLLDMAGTSLAEFLENLDTIHSILVEGFPEIRAPTFTYSQVGPGVFDLHYYSERVGLAPMVMGLVSALAKRFGESIELTHHKPRSATHDHDVLRILMLDDETAPRGT